MDDKHGGGSGGDPVEELILRTVAAHADSLIRTARRHSICFDDAQDAYQRALEIFMAHAERLDADRAPGWLHVVVKREAQAISRSRKRLVSTSEVDFDKHESPAVSTPDEQVLSFDLVSRSAEALQRLKPQELRALWLRAEGHSYNDIGAITGWSYTKVNRCLTEGRRSFLDRYACIESGAECQRWLPVLSAIVDGEATAEQMLEVRPHLRNCPGCRATLKALHDSGPPLAAVLPIPLAVAAGGGADHIANLFMRTYEALAGGLHERAVASVTKAQAAVEAAAGGKVAAVAASAAAMAGGGYATVERTVHHERADATAKTAQHVSKHAPKRASAFKPASPVHAARQVVAAAAIVRAPSVNEFGQARSRAVSKTPNEFGAAPRRREPVRAIAAEASAAKPPAQHTAAMSKPKRERVAPEFASAGASNEFGP